MSLYTWTGIIGVVLAGMTVGYFAGGRVAERWASRRLLGGVFISGAAFSLLILAWADWSGFSALDWGLVPRVLIVTATMFFIPAAILGMVTPLVAKLALRDVDRAGRTIGTIYASATAGSIVGTVTTGFVLVPLTDTHMIVAAVAAVLGATGVILAATRGAASPEVGDGALGEGGGPVEGRA
jgi:MFS family permease